MEVIVEPLLPRDAWYVVGDVEAVFAAIALVMMLDRVYGPAWRCEGMGV